MHPSARAIRKSKVARRLILCAGTVILSTSIARADTLRLKDGTSYDGAVRREDGAWVVILKDGRKVTVATDRVAGIEAAPRADAAMAQLGSLRRAADAVPDLRDVITRYRQFIQRYPGTPAAEQAAADLAVWQDRLDRKMVRAGGKWVTEEERKQLAEASLAAAEGVMELLRQGRLNEATPILDQAILDHPQNASAWYLKGLILWGQDKTPDARKAFEKVLELAPDHAPAHNNLGVVLWRQNQHVAALLSYDKAMLAAPKALAILDNLAEALASLPVDLRERTTVLRVVRHYNEQEAAVRPDMAAHGLVRWGATWVARADHDRLVAIEREIHVRLARMQADHDAAAERVKRIDDEIARCERTIGQMEASSVGVDVYGRQVRYPLPPSYNEFVRDLGNLKAERKRRVDEQELIRKQARELAATLPTPRYTGAQRMIGYEGTPVFGHKALPPVPPAAPPGPIAAPGPVAPPVAIGPGAPPAVQPPNGNPPPAAQPVPATQPAVRPPGPRVAVPPDKPSIMDRRPGDDLPPPPPLPQGDRPNYEGRPN